MAAVNWSIKLLGWTMNLLLASVALLGITVIYWVVEPDPLVVNYVDGKSWSTCADRRYPLTRDVQSSKDLTVNVKEYWWDMDGMMDVNGKMNEYPHKPITVYTLSAYTDRVFTFPKAVPKDLEPGRYRYRPHAEYKVNPLKTIRRDLPVQYVNVVCNYDEKRHGVME